jgi:cyclic pyranopterin monophosphate synthase
MKARMVDVSAKAATLRTAVAEGEITLSAAAMKLLVGGGMPKGDPFEVARLAGIMAAKRTADLIPLCHSLALSHIDVQAEAHSERGVVQVRAEVRTHARTGVEMEALVAASTALLTVYDMVKAVDKTMRIGNIRLVYKEGGKSGVYKE